ncbi:hypothetical protein [Dipodfec virus UOA04_Rod_753]|nr:hypothetical protein [Dipodfec virus UOA04_Rod_753]
MSRKVKNVYSIFSFDLDDYPYAPFVARDNYDAVAKFAHFCIDKARICNNPQLRLIGKVCLNEDGTVCTVHPMMQVAIIDLTSRKSQFIISSVEHLRKAGDCLDRFFLELSTTLTRIKKTSYRYYKKIQKG